MSLRHILQRRALPYIVLAFSFTAICGAAETAVDLRFIDDPGSLLDHVTGSPSLIVVNFWATWCAPCVAEMADLVLIDQRFDDGVVAMIGVSVEEWVPGDRKKLVEHVRKFLEDKGVRYRNLFYLGKPQPILQLYDIRNGIPVTIVLDRSGYVLEKQEGPIDPARMTALLTTFLQRMGTTTNR